MSPDLTGVSLGHVITSLNWHSPGTWSGKVLVRASADRAALGLGRQFSGKAVSDEIKLVHPPSPTRP